TAAREFVEPDAYGARRIGLSEGAASAETNLVIFNHRIGEHLVGHAAQALFEIGGARFGLVDLELDELAHAHAAHAAKTERRERAPQGVALRVEHFAFQSNVDGRLHDKPRFFFNRAAGSSRLGTNASPVMRS